MSSSCEMAYGIGKSSNLPYCVHIALCCPLVVTFQVWPWMTHVLNRIILLGE